MANSPSTSPAAEPRPRRRLQQPEAGEIIEAIHEGRVDAVLVDSLSGERVYAMHPFEAFEEHNEILQAIRGGRVDALVVKTPAGDRVFSLQGSDEPYRILFDTMQEGAATLDSDGTVLYANARFGQIVGVPAEKLVGTSLYVQFAAVEAKLHSLLQQAVQSSAKGEIQFQDEQGRNRILRLTVSPLPSYQADSQHRALCMVATDVTELFEANESLRKNEEVLQALSARLLRFQDDERKRISRELHDSAGQYLAAAIMRLAEVGDAMKSFREADGWRPLIQDAREAIESCSREIRTLSYLLHPPTLDVAGLDSALEWYCAGFASRSGISVDLEVTPGLGRLEQGLEITIYRIVQEGLTNIHRHSGSKWAGIRLVREGDQLLLEVADRGKGLGSVSGEDSRINVGVGIAGMRERVRQMNGRFTIESTSQGATLRVFFDLKRLPVSEPAESLPQSI